jgi:predicted transcriptional regulator
MTKPNMSVRVDREVADEIKELAARERRRPAQFLANLIVDALAARRTGNTEQRTAA